MQQRVAFIVDDSVQLDVSGQCIEVGCKLFDVIGSDQIRTRNRSIASGLIVDA